MLTIILLALNCAVTVVLLVVVWLKKPKVEVHMTRPEQPPAPSRPSLPSEEEVLGEIRREMQELFNYEAEHAERQRDRLNENAKAEIQIRDPVRPHGEYDADQVREHILIRLKQRFPVLPPNVHELLLRETVNAS